MVPEEAVAAPYRGYDAFASKLTETVVDVPDEQWHLPDLLSVVNYVFPNVSISGGHGAFTELSAFLSNIVWAMAFLQVWHDI